MEELREAFDSAPEKNYILSAAVPSANFRVTEGYDVPRISKALDLINVMTYDLRGPWDNEADHHAPLNGRDHDNFAFNQMNVAAVMRSWHQKGAPLEKLIMGLPFYARTFTLTSSNQNKPGDSASAPGVPGPFTDEAGFLAFYEVCHMLRTEDGWRKRTDSDGNRYAVRGDQWIGYDTPKSVKRKVIELSTVRVDDFHLRKNIILGEPPQACRLWRRHGLVHRPGRLPRPLHRREVAAAQGCQDSSER